MTIKIWGITDNRAGHLNQIQSVLQLLKGEKKLFILKNNFLGKLGFSKIPLGVKKQEIYQLKQELYKNIPNILVVIGRRNLSVSLYLKKLIKAKNPDVKLVFLMPPGKGQYKDIDLCFIHRYKIKDNKLISHKIIPIDVPPAIYSNSEQCKVNTDEDLIDTLSRKLSLQQPIIVNKPYIGVLIGGKAKGVTWNLKIAQILCDKINNLAKINNSSLIVTTSRRTGDKIATFVQNNIIKNSIFWNYSQRISHYNPYMDIVKKSDVLVVTGESVSMIADCITLNPKAKVLIFDDEKFNAKRFQNFRYFIYSNNYAISLQNGNLSIINIKEHKKLINPVYFIANTINSLL